MNLLARIFGRIAFVRAEFTADGTCRTEAFLRHGGVLAPADRSAAKSNLCCIAVCGHGVVTKPDGSEIAVRVKADPKTFLCSTVGSRTSFVRRERLQPLLDELTAAGIVPVRLFCAEAGVEFGAQVDDFAGQLLDGLRWCGIVGVTPEASATAQALARRTALPVLGLMLCLLAVNAVLIPRLDTRRQALRAAIAAREQSVSNASTSEASLQELLSAFVVRPHTPQAVVCDRIAGAVPERIVLKRLAVEPLSKRFEGGKPLQRRENLIVIIGTAQAVSDVSAFVRELSELACFRDVRLTSMEKERESDYLTFCIETVP